MEANIDLIVIDGFKDAMFKIYCFCSNKKNLNRQTLEHHSCQKFLKIFLKIPSWYILRREI